MAKRIKIPDEIATNLLYISDKTCCICHNSRLSIQIHHIDENSGNNSIENLAVLCSNCHDETSLKGGFGRKLNSKLVRKYRDEWHKEVFRLRDEAYKSRLSLQSPLGYIYRDKEEYNLNDVISIYIISKIDLYIDKKKEYEKKNLPKSTIELIEFNTYVSQQLIHLARDLSQFCKGEAFERSEVFYPAKNQDYFDCLFDMAYEWAKFTNNFGGTIGSLFISLSANNILKSFVADLMETLFPLEGNANQIDKIIHQFKKA